MYAIMTCSKLLKCKYVGVCPYIKLYSLTHPARTSAFIAVTVPNLNTNGFI